MGVIYKVHDPHLDLFVASKVPLGLRTNP